MTAEFANLLSGSEDRHPAVRAIAGREHQASPVLTSGVCAGSVKRVAGTVGEGAAVVAQLHEHLSERDRQSAAAGP